MSSIHASSDPRPFPHPAGAAADGAIGPDAGGNAPLSFAGSAVLCRFGGRMRASDTSLVQIAIGKCNDLSAATTVLAEQASAVPEAPPLVNNGGSSSEQGSIDSGAGGGREAFPLREAVRTT